MAMLEGRVAELEARGGSQTLRLLSDLAARMEAGPGGRRAPREAEPESQQPEARAVIHGERDQLIPAFSPRYRGI